MGVGLVMKCVELLLKQNTHCSFCCKSHLTNCTLLTRQNISVLKVFKIRLAYGVAVRRILLFKKFYEAEKLFVHPSVRPFACLSRANLGCLCMD